MSIAPPPVPPPHRRNPTCYGAPDKNEITAGSRPVSFYDNCVEQQAIDASFDASHKYDTLLIKSGQELADKRSPTQAHCLITTVPQNIIGNNIASKKHTPTRNSLRHSRMIALNHNGTVSKQYLPATIRCHKLAKGLLGLILLLGAALCFLALWLLLWAPNLRHQDNPHWSGIPVLLSAIIGLFLLCCCRKQHASMKKSYFINTIKLLSVSLSTLAAFAAFAAFAFSVLHLSAIYAMTCEPPVKLDTSCVCRKWTNETATNRTHVNSYHYIDLTCLEVENVLPILMIFSCAANLMAGTLETWYVYLHWASRYVYTYAKVQTSKSKPSIIRNLR